MSTPSSERQSSREKANAGEGEAPSPPPAGDPRKESVHRLRNELFSIVLQAHCAQCNLQDGRISDLEESLAHIETRACATQEMLDDLLVLLEG